MTLSTSSPSSITVTLQQLLAASSSDDRHSLQQVFTANMTAAVSESSHQITAVQLDAVINIPFQQFCLDSRQLASNDVFVLLKSHTPNCQKSRDHLYQAANNAAFILSEIDPRALLNTTSVSNHADITLPNDSTAKAQQQLVALPCPVLHVPNIRDFLGTLIQARLQYQQPVTLPTVIAVTGTNGKTTISQLVAQLTQLTGMSSAVMGTAGNGRFGALVQASHTTGDVLAVQQFLYQMGKEGAELLALEASSHGLDQQRLQGMPVSVAIYTNLSRDHLDYHADMAEYAAAKAKLFDKAHFPDLTHAIINIDDEHAQIMLDTAHASNLTVWTYSLDSLKTATFVAANITPSLRGVEISLRTDFDDGTMNHLDIVSPLLGRFNVANLLAAMAAAVALGISLEHIAAVVPQLQGAVGRMQRVPSNDGCFIVDYAHTPDALSQVLASLKTHCKGQLWAVFGCGGDRDAGKRPLMAQAGLAGADKVVLTADNPRTEDPNAILQDMQVGMSTEQYQRTHIEPARQAAIEYAVNQAAADDIVVIAGKGHETYQEINHVRYDFDDSVILQNALKQAGRV
ncbi:UDP-N-acetylmuramoyl-L-alanyl-D-glutamate--2,6-diaminopimelate ligase [Psychrobacter cryohalolentis]|uniref:UDP-N-acetylmuramoyl-L-alanyl-D-glutamate--2,6-diaminopimelate ligase n=1 Tax=Psychrobacter cryohalolentis (strain ATCC BAA-1226 / DSM 17306 / VKM B-2378 / K5) TaxID=335284 RepID=Q1Q849_PSYCK|nr:UDP-N-acetylmuramoyl-L-alanyl-D-glutamate--2,6-diaminopimelate ligase [Psychrobacter cryohalolentis]ABE76154.1 UDP-N-acetylmuramoylalanyl-D-glutamate--2,6-diaminopimelate ligase [Psychrobacter cryohalolentis K5]ASE26333.1 UDP-N-acetylmuramoyl-L-alanyl-D-glutamate--2,6-diaminopimelate ligase [Psychrobacter cryohalolentis]